MRNRKKILVAVAAVVVAVAIGGVCIWAFFLREREGIHDERIAHPSVSDRPSYANCLVHSTDEFDAGTYHLTAWYIVRKSDGTFVRRHVATLGAWNRLFQDGRTRVIQLPKGFMDKYLPVEQGVDALRLITTAPQLSAA